MASITSGFIRLPALGKRKMAQLAAMARSHGVTPEDYAKQLVEDGLAIQREAEAASFADIMAPVRSTPGKVDDAEIVALVDQARRGSSRTSLSSKRR